MDATPRERRRDKTRRALLAAALELTEASGPTGWTMRELADRIDFTTTATYRYFASKDAVLDALVDDALAGLWQELTEAVDRAPSDARPVDVVFDVALAYLAYARANPTAFRLALVESSSRRSSLEEAPADGSAYTVLLRAVQAAIDRGELATTDAFGPEDVAFTIWSTIHGMAVLETTHLQAFAPRIEAAAGHGVRRLLAGLAIGGPPAESSNG